MTSFFVLIVRIKQEKHCGLDTYLIACQNSANDNCLCLSSSQKLNGLLALLGLDISFPEKSAQQEIRCGVFFFQTSVTFFLAMRSHSPAGLSELVRHHFLVHVHRNTNQFTGIALPVFGNLFCVFESVLLIAWFLTFNVVEQTREYDSASEIPQFRASKQCPNASLDLECCVA